MFALDIGVERYQTRNTRLELTYRRRLGLPQRRLSVDDMTLIVLLWSAGFSFAKLGVAQAGPVTFLALRYLLVLAAVGVAIASRAPAQGPRA